MCVWVWVGVTIILLEGARAVGGESCTSDKSGRINGKREIAYAHPREIPPALVG